jgi:PAS domain S-box-containing protein
VDDVEASGMPESLVAAIRAEGIRALAFFPLAAGGRLVGKFMAYYEVPHAFTKDDENLAVTIARQLGFSIDRRRTEDDLRRNEERLRLASQAGKIGLWEWNIADNTVSWSDSLYGMHGVEKEDFDATVEGFTALVHPEDRTRVGDAIRNALTEDAPYELEFRIRRPDGEIIWIFTNALLLRSDGKPQRMLGATVDITDRKRAEEQRDLLVAELSHRVKNTLAIVISIAQRSFAKARSVEEARRSFEARIRALAQTHGRLADTHWSGISLATMLLDELAPYRSDDGANLRLSGPPILLGPRCALALGLGIHELATNAAKYGALSARAGIVDIAWEKDREDGMLRIRWTERGGPPIVAPVRSGFGRLLLERALASDLGGTVALDFAAEGLRCTIAIPLAEHVVE